VGGIIVSSSVLSARGLLSFEEVAGRCGVTVELVEELVRHGVVDVEAGPVRQVRAEVTLRIRTVARLQEDLGVNAAGAAVILELLERIEQLEDQLYHRR
jgi:hypothetical protein